MNNLLAIELQQLREQLAPIWANLMTGPSTAMGNYLNTLSNLGVPGIGLGGNLCATQGNSPQNQQQNGLFGLPWA